MTDISLTGIGFELLGKVPENLIGHRLIFEVPTPIGSSVTVRIVGEVKYLLQGPQGETCAGIEFVDLSDTERKVLQVMELLQIVW